MHKAKTFQRVLFFFMVFVYVLLDSRYNLPGNTILRWVLPILMLLESCLNRQRLDIPELFFYVGTVALFLFSCFFSLETTYSLSRLISFVLITLTCYNYFLSLKDREEMFVAIKLMGIIFLIYEILNFIFIGSSMGGRSRGITGNPNSLGVWSNIAFLFAIYFFLNVKTKRSKCFMVILMVISVLTAIASGSRTYTIAILLNIFFATQLLLTRKTRVWFWLIAILSILIGFSAFKGILMNIQGINRLLTEGRDRGDIWDAGLKLVREKPLLGWGYGISQQLNTQEYLGYIDGYTSYGMAFHNSFLTVLIETGLVGLFFIVMLIGSITIKGAKVAVLEKNKKLAVVIMMVITMLLCFYGGSAMTSVGSTEGFFFWCTLCWLLVYTKKQEKEMKSAQSELLLNQRNKA